MTSKIIPISQWEFQDPKMEVLCHIRPYFVGIFPYIGLIYGMYLQLRILKWPLVKIWFPGYGLNVDQVMVATDGLFWGDGFSVHQQRHTDWPRDSIRFNMNLLKGLYECHCMSQEKYAWKRLWCHYHIILIVSHSHSIANVYSLLINYFPDASAFFISFRASKGSSLAA